MACYALFFGQLTFAASGKIDDENSPVVIAVVGGSVDTLLKGVASVRTLDVALVKFVTAPIKAAMGMTELVTLVAMMGVTAVVRQLAELPEEPDISY